MKPAYSRDQQAYQDQCLDEVNPGQAFVGPQKLSPEGKYKGKHSNRAHQGVDDGFNDRAKPECAAGTQIFQAMKQNGQPRCRLLLWIGTGQGLAHAGITEAPSLDVTWIKSER